MRKNNSTEGFKETEEARSGSMSSSISDLGG